MAAASPVSALPHPSIHASPRQQTLSSKIPRRRPSAQLAAAVGGSPRAASSPVAAPSSPTKSALAGGGGHARKVSAGNRAHFSDLPPTVFSSSAGGSLGGELASRLGSSGEGGVEAPSPALQDRRRRTSSSTETREFSSSSHSGRRTPSLSIYIPSAPSSHPHHSASSLRRPSQPAASRASPSSSSAHPSTSSPAHPFAPHSRRSSARTPRSSTHSVAVVRPPMMERTWSNSTTTTTYTSFDLQHPRTPKEEREERELMMCKRRRERRGWLRRALGWVGLSSSGSSGADDDEEQHVGERAPLFSPEATGVSYGTRAEGSYGAEQDAVRREEGTGGSGGWRYVAGATWCYAKHVLPPLLFFVALVLVIALLAYRQAIHRVVHPPEA